MRLPFRPVRKVKDPDGREWELYVTKTVLPEWKEGSSDGDAFDALGPAAAPLWILVIPLMLLGVIWSAILSPLLRFVCLYPFALIKGRRSRAARVEAVCFSSAYGIETRRWTTTADQADSVLATIAIAIEEGRPPQLVGAVYQGFELSA
ncbi:MAG TPA: hypothetical protein VGM80_06850 [Gaiellaceae bacterium]|jgi:hypothetical protein